MLSKHPHEGLKVPSGVFLMRLKPQKVELTVFYWTMPEILMKPIFGQQNSKSAIGGHVSVRSQEHRFGLMTKDDQMV